MCVADFPTTVTERWDTGVADFEAVSFDGQDGWDVLLKYCVDGVIRVANVVVVDRISEEKGKG